jgi:two-component system, cell cycle sensor histidine kinase and response regulator CckA
MRILLVDDEPSIREVLTDMLVAHGFTVVTAKDGVEGISVYRHDDEGFDFVVSDYQMPRMNGIIMIAEIRAMQPEQKIVLQSASNSRELAELMELLEVKGVPVPILEKPFSVKALVEILEGKNG